MFRQQTVPSQYLVVILCHLGNEIVHHQLPTWGRGGQLVGAPTTYYGTDYYGTAYYGTAYYGTAYYGIAYYGTTYACYGTYFLRWHRLLWHCLP